MVCKLLFSALSAAKSCSSRAAFVLVDDPVAVDMGTLATVEEAVDAAPPVEGADGEDLGSLRLLRGTGLGLIRDPAAESSLPSDPDGGDTVRCGMGLFCGRVPAEAADRRCRPSCSI